MKAEIGDTNQGMTKIARKPPEVRQMAGSGFSPLPSDGIKRADSSIADFQNYETVSFVFKLHS
jgi:hypothetical protein